jgi:hypothetical protein
MFQVLNKVTGGKPRATRRSSGGRRVILKALNTAIEFGLFPNGPLCIGAWDSGTVGSLEACIFEIIALMSNSKKSFELIN